MILPEVIIRAGIWNPSTKNQHRVLADYWSMTYHWRRSLACSDAGPAAASKVPPPQVPLFSEPHQPPKEVHGCVINHCRVAVPSSGAAAVTGAGDTQPLPCVKMEFPKLLRNAFDAIVSPIDVHAGMVHDCTVTFSVSWCRALSLCWFVAALCPSCGINVIYPERSFCLCESRIHHPTKNTQAALISHHWMFFQFFWTISWAIQHLPFIFHGVVSPEVPQRGAAAPSVEIKSPSAESTGVLVAVTRDSRTAGSASLHADSQDPIQGATCKGQPWQRRVPKYQGQRLNPVWLRMHFSCPGELADMK